MYDPFVALIVSNVPSAFSTSNRISPSRTANHAAESGYMRRSYFVPTGSCTKNETELPSSMTGSRQLACALCLALTSAMRVTAFIGALCSRTMGLG